MKKLRLIPFVLLGFSLAFGAVAALAEAPKKAEPAHAAEDGMIYVGNVNMFSNSDPFSGKAILTSTTNGHTLTLNGYNNNAVYSIGETTTCNILVYNITKPLTIVVKGTNNIINPTTSKASAYGIYAYSNVENKAFTLNIVGEGSNPVLNIEAKSVTENSTALFWDSALNNGQVNIENCTVNATSGVSGKYSYAFDLTGSSLNIKSGAKVTAFAGGLNLTNTTYRAAYGIYAKSYYQTGGEVTTTCGPTNKRGEPYGLKATGGHIFVQNGKLKAEAKNSEERSSIGMYADTGSVYFASGAEVTAIGGAITGTVEEGARSFGVGFHTTDTEKIFIDPNIKYVYAYTNHNNTSIARGLMGVFQNQLVGYRSDSNIFEDENRIEIPVTSTYHDYFLSRQFYFQKFTYTATAAAITTYDGNEHPALTMSVSYPVSATVEYRLKNTSAWSTTIPSFTDANQDGYVVEYRISATNYLPVTGEVTFYINKATPLVSVVPTLVATFEADGETLTDLVNPGTCEGGVIKYSVNGGEYSEEIPAVKYAGEYEVSYKVDGGDNYQDIVPVSLGTVVVTGTEAPVPEPTPTPEPVDPSPSPKGGISGGAVAGIVIGSLVFVIGAAYLVLFFLLNKWIKVGDKAVRVLRFALGKKDGKERYLAFNCKFQYRDKNEVFNTKDEALK